MYFLLPGIVSQVSGFIVDGLIDDAVDLSYLCPVSSQNHRIVVAVDYSFVEIVSNQLVFLEFAVDESSIDIVRQCLFKNIESGIDLSNYEAIDSQLHPVPNAAQDLTFIDSGAIRRKAIYQAADLSGVIDLAYLPSDGRVVETAVDLSGYDVGELPADVSGIIGVIDFAVDNSLVDRVSGQLHDRFLGVDQSVLEVAGNQLFFTNEAELVSLLEVAEAAPQYVKNALLQTIIEIADRRIQPTPNLAADSGEILKATQQKHKIDIAVDNSGLINQAALITNP